MIVVCTTGLSSSSCFFCVFFDMSGFFGDAVLRDDARIVRLVRVGFFTPSDDIAEIVCSVGVLVFVFIFLGAVFGERDGVRGIDRYKKIDKSFFIIA